MNETSNRLEDVCAWHDVEHSAYAVDLVTLRELAGRHGDPVVDLGAGTGRVSLDLAARGRRVIAVEVDHRLASTLAERAAERSLPVEVVIADARELYLPQPVPLVLAPMQFLHIVGGPGGRRAVLARVASSLAPDGLFAASVLNSDLPEGTWRPDPIPDVRELDGWIHSSLATEIEVGEATIVLRRLRQVVSPSGELEESEVETVLDRFGLADLEREASSVGLEVIDFTPLPRSHEHEDSAMVTMKRSDSSR